MLGNGFDQPRIIADKNDLYITASRAGVAVIRSADSGATFELTTVSPNNLGNQPTNPLILADGSLVVPFSDFPNFPDAQPASSRIWILRSTDQGKTFDHPHFIADIPRSWSGGGVGIAASHDRLFAVWDSGDFGGRVLATGANFKREEVGNRRDIAIAYSLNNGKTWSKPKQIEQPGLGPAFMGSIDVAPNGTIGLFWIRHERYETNPKPYRTWFAASADNGETFTQPKVVSSAISNPDPARLTKIDYLAHRPRGGDYIRVIAAADSSFHAVWSDARDGQFRVYHARIQVTV